MIDLGGAGLGGIVSAPGQFTETARTATRGRVKENCPLRISSDHDSTRQRQVHFGQTTDQLEALKETAAHLAALPKSDEKPVLKMPQAAGGQ